MPNITCKKTDSSWFGSSWNYTAQVETNAMRLDIDDYQDIAPTRTTYQYDTLSNLTAVVSPPVGSTTYTTTMTYNALGQKIAMSDPDMGNWSYGYDTAGNLTSQTDANGTELYFVYDALSRLTYKRTTDVGTAPCDVGNPCLATYSYDDTTNGNKGIGRRTSMNAFWGLPTLLPGNMTFWDKYYKKVALSPLAVLSKSTLSNLLILRAGCLSPSDTQAMIVVD